MFSRYQRKLLHCSTQQDPHHRIVIRTELNHFGSGRNILLTRILILLNDLQTKLIFLFQTFAKMKIINVEFFFFLNMKYKSHDNFLYNPIPATYKITNKIKIFHKQLQKSKLAVQKFTFLKALTKTGIHANSEQSIGRIRIQSTKH